MDKITKLPDRQRSEIFQETAARKGMTANVVEKDFWVCWVLGKIFSTSVISEKIMFKGGTSLSKVFGLIERFSEDIDLILDWKEITDEDPMENRSKSRQEKFNRNIVVQSQMYLQDTLLPEFTECLSGLCTMTIDKDDPNAISIAYPAAFKAGYLRPEIKLEIGPLAIWVPNDRYVISSYAAQEFPDQFDKANCTVRAIKAEHTFWEKATILHHEFHRPKSSPQPPRYSRHYYDLAMMVKTEVKDKALEDFDLLASVVESKMRFYPRGWAKYDLAKPGTLKLVPPEYLKNSLQRDYEQMRGMIFGEYPSFEEVVSRLEKLEREIGQES